MENLQQILSIKIGEEYGFPPEVAVSQAANLYHLCPKEILTNLEQWAQGEPLSEICIGPYSVPMVMAIWKVPDFLGAVEVLSLYAAGDCDTAQRRIWRMRR